MSKKKNGEDCGCLTRLGEQVKELRGTSCPVMLHQRCDISAACYRKGEDGQPMELRVQGEAEYSLLRALAVGGCTVLGVYVLCRAGKLIREAKIRRRCRKKMEAQYAAREQKRRERSETGPRRNAGARKMPDGAAR